MLYESGARVGEVARLRWRDVEFDEYGIGVHIHDTKENQVRYARCTWAREMLAAWKNVYPAELTPDAWVFLSSRKEAMNYAQIRQRIKMAAERAGLEKRVHLHLFRKCRATHMIQQNYQESVIKKMLWGNLGTQMFETYVVLSEADIDAEILGQAGIERREAAAGPARPGPVPALPRHLRADLPVLLVLRPGALGRGRRGAGERKGGVLEGPGVAHRAGGGDPASEGERGRGSAARRAVRMTRRPRSTRAGVAQ